MALKGLLTLSGTPQVQPFAMQRAGFQASLIITDAPFSVPEEPFTLLLTERSAVIENYPQDSWPKILIQLEAPSSSSKLEVQRFLIDRSASNVMAEILFTRLMFTLTQKCGCLIPLPGGIKLHLGVSPLGDLEQQKLILNAKLFRKLKYLEEFFHTRFALPNLITADEVGMADFVFRGVTEGTFSVWRNQIAFSQVTLPPTTNLGAPPFNSPGSFTLTAGESATILGQTIPIGPVTTVLEGALCSNANSLADLHTHPNKPVDLQFEINNQQIVHRFERFVGKSLDELRSPLEQFKRYLRQEESEELVSLMDQSLQGAIRYVFLDAFNQFSAEHAGLLQKLAE